MTEKLKFFSHSIQTYKLRLLLEITQQYTMHDLSRLNYYKTLR